MHKMQHPLTMSNCDQVASLATAKCNKNCEGCLCKFMVKFLVKDVETKKPMINSPYSLVMLVSFAILYFLLRSFLKNRKWTVIIVLIFLFIVIVIWRFFIGYYWLALTEDNSPQFFLKHYPSYQMEFVYIYRDGDVDFLPFSHLSLEEKKELMTFCRYRYGINAKNDDNIKKCIYNDHPDLDLEHPNH